MASVPATTADMNPPATISDAPEAVSPEVATIENEMLLGFNKLTLLRQIGLMVGLAASVALGFAVVLWSQEPDYQPLMGNIQNMDVEQITTLLNQNDIGFKVEPKTGLILVESDDIYRARLKLASSGLTEDKSVGFELLDQEQALGTSQFMESARYRRGLEGEIARTITSLRSVKSARVHLAIPKRSVFVRDNRKPSASIFVEVFAGQDIGREQVSSIVNLVASSVPEMDKKDVTVVDQRGNLLSRNDDTDEDRMVSREFEYTRKLEGVLNGRIASMLELVIGAGRFRSEVSAEVDFNAVEQAEELFNPDQQALRSEQALDEQRSGGSLGGVPGALSNQPPGKVTVPEVATGADGEAAGKVTDSRRQTTRNFEVDRTVSYTKHQKGRVKRLTIAVAVDDIRRVDPATGKVVFSSWSDAELERLTLLVRNAVGYSAVRGDSVNVINTPFAPEEALVSEDIPLWQQPWFWDKMKPVMAGLVVLILVFGLLRPTLKNLTQSGQQAKELALAGDEEGLAELDRIGEEMEAGSLALGAGDDFLLPGASEGYDKKVNALKGLIAEDPARVAQVIRQWINSDA
ncbi:MAG: flagellar M-ring protein FliF [Hahellaceae bacterium]|nr:flagellar M-ring protein FliF [Hahellaceae bacterium]